MQRRRFLHHTLLGALPASAVLRPAATRAQVPYPTRPVRYIVPVAAGGGSDLVGRAVCEQLSRLLGQNFVVDNQGGGGGVIAAQATVRAAPDGYTLLQGYVATHGTSPATRKLPYDPIRDFTPVGMIGATPNVLVVNPALEVRDVRGLIDLAARTPGGLSYGSAGPGSLTHLTAELFRQATGASLQHIPYRGIAPAITDLIGGQTQLMFPGLAAALPHLRLGRLRALAVTGESRHPLLPEVPTFEQAGLAGFDAAQWYGVVGPAGLPAPVVQTLNAGLARVLSRPEFRERLSAEAIEPRPMTAEAFGATIRSEVARWTRLARERGIQLDG